MYEGKKSWERRGGEEGGGRRRKKGKIRLKRWRRQERGGEEGERVRVRGRGE